MAANSALPCSPWEHIKCTSNELCHCFDIEIARQQKKKNKDTQGLSLGSVIRILKAAEQRAGPPLGGHLGSQPVCLWAVPFNSPYN